MKQSMWILVGALCALPACTRQENRQTGGIEMGAWRAVVTVPGGELPFAIDLVAADGGTRAYLINGPERVEVEEVYLDGDSLHLNLTAFDSRIGARMRGGRLRGWLELVKRGGKSQVMPLVAEHGVGYRFFRDPPPPDIDVSGRWDVTFFDDRGRTSKGVAELEQDGAALFGTFLTPTGDYRYLAGEVKDRTIHLSCFDGGHAFLFTARLGDGGELRGDFWSGTAWHERWTATRDEAAALPDPTALTQLKPGYDRLAFAFPDINGEMVSASDEVFRGKVVIVTLAGSWCPNCHDEAAFLAPYYDLKRGEGLEIVALMYEHYRDFDKAVKQVTSFRDRYDIHYRLLVAGYSDKKEAADTLPMLDGVLAFPTTIFVDRTGVVRRIHTGFSGPATGDHFERFKSEFSRFVDELLSE